MGYKEWYAANKETLKRRRLTKQTLPPGWKLRKSDLQPVRVYSLEEVARRIGRSPDTIRYWEEQGYIPRWTVDSGRRYYTRAQLRLLRILRLVIGRHGMLQKWRWHKKRMKWVVTYIANRWDYVPELDDTKKEESKDGCESKG